MFFFGPALLMDGSVVEILLAVAVGLISVFCIATAVVGYFLQPLGALGRLTMAASGLLLMYQSLVTNLIGIGLLAAIFFLTRQQANPVQNP